MQRTTMSLMVGDLGGGKIRWRGKKGREKGKMGCECVKSTEMMIICLFIDAD